MKNNQLTFMLVGLFFFATLGTAGLILRYNSSVHRLQDMQVRANSANTLRQYLVSLVNESTEYSKKNPGFETILQALTSKPATPATPAPAAKLPGK